MENIEHVTHCKAYKKQLLKEKHNDNQEAPKFDEQDYFKSYTGAHLMFLVSCMYIFNLVPMAPSLLLLQCSLHK